jgi:TolA-binding protein
VRLKTQDSRLVTRHTLLVTRYSSPVPHSPTSSLTRSPVTRHSLLVTILCLTSLLLGCGAAWHGRVVHLEDGKVIIQSEGEGQIESGRRLRIYRQKTIVHPVTGEVLDTIKDDIAEVPVVKVRKRTVTASAPELEFSMMTLDDQAKAIRGSVDLMPGSVHEVGRVRDVDTENLRATCQVTVDPATLASGGILTVVRYSGTVIDPDTGEFLAIAVKPVADLQVTKIDDDIIYASYRLVDEKIGWIETDDVVARRTGSMAIENLWFQDPPDGFSEDWIFSRNYWHAIRQYNSGLYREAILELNDVVQMNPEYKDTAYLLGLCCANLNRYEEAIPLFRDILARKPDDAKILTSLAYAYLKQNKLQEAADTYEKLASISSGNPEVWVDLGDIYNALGDHQKAEQAYRKALEIDATNEDAAYELQSQPPGVIQSEMN